MSETAKTVSGDERHYLEVELESLIRTDPAMWRFIREGSLDGVWYWDLEHPDCEWMSPELWRLFGIDPATKRHDPKEWQHLIFPEDLALAVDNLHRHCADPEFPYDQIVRYLHADGSTVWVRCRGVAIRDENGRPIRMLGAHNDLTAVKRAEEVAQTAQALAETANDELRSFAYSVSHDLKAPSNTVSMILAEIVEADEGGLSEDQRMLVEMGQRTVNRMRELVEDLLDYTRLIGDEVPRMQVDLAQIASAAVETLAADIREAGATVEIEPLPNVFASPVQMRTLFHNLISNAVKFRRAGTPPVVRITARKDEDNELELSFADNGIGIAPENRNRIFDLFGRLHRHEEYGGTGLGLTLCRRVAINHGGDISVAQNEGGGTVFRVTLPGRPE